MGNFGKYLLYAAVIGVLCVRAITYHSTQVKNLEKKVIQLEQKLKKFESLNPCQPYQPTLQYKAKIPYKKIPIPTGQTENY